MRGRGAPLAAALAGAPSIGTALPPAAEPAAGGAGRVRERPTRPFPPGGGRAVPNPPPRAAPGRVRHVQAKLLAVRPAAVTPERVTLMSAVPLPSKSISNVLPASTNRASVRLLAVNVAVPR